MCLPLFPEEDWPPFSADWPTSGSMRNGICSAHETSAPLINENDCSSWPTATTADSRSSARHTTTTSVMHPGTMLTDAARAFWPTASARDGDPRRAHTGRDTMAWQNKVARGAVNAAGMLSDDLSSSAVNWPTPAARDYKGENGTEHLTAGTGRKHLDQLPNFVAHLWQTPQTDSFRSRSADRKDEQGLDQQARFWPTPTAEPYGSSQNGINGIGGAHERPSANTPSLDRLSRSFLPAQVPPKAGDASSPTGPSSHRHGKPKLNPEFVRWLMGFPHAWTNCGPSATQWSRWRQRMRSSLWQLARGAA